MEYLSKGSPHFECVHRLLAENSGTLGFFPKGALRDYVERGQVLVALSGSECVGCLTFRPRRDAIRIVHLCVAHGHRGSGVARKLTERLSADKKHYVGISLKCRADYGLDAFWRRLGFVPGKEGTGRGRDRARLVSYWLDHRHPGLFDALPSPRIRVVLDAGIVLDLLEERNEESLALGADWVADDVEFLYTPYVFEDLEGKQPTSELARTLARIDWLNPLRCDPAAVEQAAGLLHSALGFENKPAWDPRPTIRQVASAIVAGCSFFVTHDHNLIKQGPTVCDAFGISLVRPAELITHIDELKDRAKYQPARLGGTPLTCRRVSTGQVELLADRFLAQGRESTSLIQRRLYTYLSSPVSHDVLAVFSGAEPCGLAVQTLTRDGCLEVPLLRTAGPADPYLVGVYLLAAATERAAREERLLVAVTDTHVPESLIQALLDLDFAYRSAAWSRFTIPRLGPALRMRDELLGLAARYPEQREGLEDLADSLHSAWSLREPRLALRTEQALWPLKLTDTPVSSYIVPIKPKWAAQLFDSRLAAQELFGVNESLMLRPQNVYYRRKRPGLPEGPGRVLWYVSGDRQYGGSTQCLRACSYVDRVDYGDADTCYERYRHLGVFSRQDVRELARGEPVMAFTFSHTELLDYPVPFRTVRAIIRECQGEAPILQAPCRVTPASFARLYWLGKYGSLEGFQVEESPAPFYATEIQ